MSKAKKPKYIETQEQIDKRETGYLTPIEIQKVIKNIQYGIGNEKALWYQKEYRSRDMSMVLLFLSTGIRVTALQNLDVEDLNLEERHITVTDKGNKVNVHDLPDDTVTVLKKWLIKREALLGKDGVQTEHALFISKRRTRMSYTAINDVVCKYCSNITGKHITPHKLRATYGTMLYNRTHDIEFVREQMNHNSVVTTQRYIRGNGKANRKKAASIMGDIISHKRREMEDLFAEEETTIVDETFDEVEDDDFDLPEDEE